MEKKTLISIIIFLVGIIIGSIIFKFTFGNKFKEKIVKTNKVFYFSSKDFDNKNITIDNKPYKFVKILVNGTEYYLMQPVEIKNENKK